MSRPWPPTIEAAIDSRLPNFSFIIDGLLAGMARPGAFAPQHEDLKRLKERGIAAIVSLTVEGLDRQLLSENRLRYLHLPIADFGPPTLGQVDDFLELLRAVEEAGEALAVHCWAGMGRTGTMLACALVDRGLSAEEAIDEVRHKRPGSIESLAQEQLIERYSAARRRSPPRSSE